MTTTATATQAELDAQAYAALQDADGNATKAAAALGMVRSTFQNRIKRHTARMAQDEAERADDAVTPAEMDEFLRQPYEAAEDEAQTPAELPDPVHNGDVFARIEASNPGMAETDAVLADEDSEPQVAEPAAAAEEEAPAAPPAPVKVNWTRQAGRKNVEVNFPDGVVTPIAFRHHLIVGGDAPATLTSQRVYTMTGAKGFPVRHYDATGTAYDAPQDRDGVRVTRPGVDLAAARAWYLAKQA